MRTPVRRIFVPGNAPVSNSSRNRTLSFRFFSSGNFLVLSVFRADSRSATSPRSTCATTHFSAGLRARRSAPFEADTGVMKAASNMQRTVVGSRRSTIGAHCLHYDWEKCHGFAFGGGGVAGFFVFGWRSTWLAVGHSPSLAALVLR